jgi:hypothetical protein
MCQENKVGTKSWGRWSATVSAKKSRAVCNWTGRHGLQLQLPVSEVPNSNFVTEIGYPGRFLVVSSLWQTVLSILGSKSAVTFLPYHSFRPLKSSSLALGADFERSSCLMERAFGRNGLHLNHTHSMPPVDLELQCDQAPAVLADETAKVLRWLSSGLLRRVD